MGKRVGVFRPVRGNTSWLRPIATEIFDLFSKNRDLQIKLISSVGIMLLHPLDVEQAFLKRHRKPNWSAMGKRLLDGVKTDNQIYAETTSGLIFPLERGLGKAVLALGLQPNATLRTDTKVIYQNLNRMLGYTPEDDDYIIAAGSVFTIPLARLDEVPSGALAADLSTIVNAHSPSRVNLGRVAPTSFAAV